jgi:hypothetical protein
MAAGANGALPIALRALKLSKCDAWFMPSRYDRLVRLMQSWNNIRVQAQPRYLRVMQSRAAVQYRRPLTPVTCLQSKRRELE